MRERPRRERLLHLRVEPLLRRDPSLDQRKVDQAQGGGPLQRGELGERHPRVIPVHGHQQDAAGARVQRPRPLQELHAAYPWQPQISCHQCHLTAPICKPAEGVQALLSSAGRQHLVVRAKPAHQRGHGLLARTRVRVNDDQDGPAQPGGGSSHPPPPQGHDDAGSGPPDVAASAPMPSHFPTSPPAANRTRVPPQNCQLRAATITEKTRPPPDQNGGSARGYLPGSPRWLAGPVMVQHEQLSVYLCISALGVNVLI